MSVDEANSAYRKYTSEVGFHGKDGNVQTRYLFCSREGVPDKHAYDTLGIRSGEHKVRKSNVKRTGCKACIKFRYRKQDGCYVVYKLEERHNHRLYDSVDKRFSRSRRQLKYTDYRNIYNSSGSSIGGARCHSIHTALKGGVEYVGATSVEYKNA